MIVNLLGGWAQTPLKNDGVKVSWDVFFTFPTEWKVIKFHGSKAPTSIDLIVDALTWAFPKAWGYPNSWIVFFREKSIYKWMMIWGTPMTKRKAPKMFPWKPSGLSLGGCSSGWWYTYPSEKYESQIGSSSPIWLGKIKKKTCSKPPTSGGCSWMSLHFPLIFPWFSSISRG